MIVKNRNVPGGNEFWDRVEYVAKNIQTPMPTDTSDPRPSRDQRHASEIITEASRLGFSAADSSWKQLYNLAVAACEANARESTKELREALPLLEEYWKAGCACGDSSEICDLCKRTAVVLEREKLIGA